MSNRQLPIEMMLDGLTWAALPPPTARSKDNIPYATHEGVLEIMGLSLRCYRLSNGMAVFDADDVHAFFSEELPKP